MRARKLLRSFLIIRTSWENFVNKIFRRKTAEHKSDVLKNCLKV